MNNRSTKVLLFAACATLIGCSGAKIDALQLDYDNGVAYKHGSTEPFNGVAVFNGTPDVVKQYHLEVANISSIATPGTATRECDVHFRGGTIEGDVDCTDDHGDKAYHFTIKNGRYDGRSAFYFKGEPVNEFNWKDGALEGLQRNYSGDGKYIVHEWTVKDGHKVGKEVRRASDGEDLAEGEWSDNGKFTGTMFVQDSDAPTVYTLKDGVKNGPFKKFDVQNYSDLKHDLVEGNFKNDAPDGTLTFYRIGYFEQFYLGGRLALGGFGQLLNIPGIKLLEAQWSNSVMQGEIKGLDEERRVLISFNFQDGQIQPPVVRFDPTTGKTSTFTDAATINALNHVAGRDPNVVLGVVGGPRQDASTTAAAQQQQAAPQAPDETETRIASVVDPTQVQPPSQQITALTSSSAAANQQSSTTAPNSELEACVSAWAAAYRKEQGQDVVVTQDQLGEWQQWCSQGKRAP